MSYSENNFALWLLEIGLSWGSTIIPLRVQVTQHEPQVMMDMMAFEYSLALES